MTVKENGLWPVIRKIITFVGVALLVLLLLNIVNFLRFHYIVKNEAYIYLKQIAEAEYRYFEEHGHYIGVYHWPDWTRPEYLDRGFPMPWDDCREFCPGFSLIGWKPDKKEVWFSYEVLTSYDGDAFMIIAQSDLDGDRTWSKFQYMEPGNLEGVKVETIQLLFSLDEGLYDTFKCRVSGAYNSKSGKQDLLREPGPCEKRDGVNDF